MRRAARTDANHAEIVQALRKVGCRVLDLRSLGNGCPDLLVDTGSGLALMEVKTSDGHLRQSQQDFVSAGWRVWVIRSVPDALKVVWSYRLE